MKKLTKTSPWARLYDAAMEKINDGLETIGMIEAATQGRNQKIGQFEGQEYDSSVVEGAPPIETVPTADLAYRRRNVLHDYGMGYDDDAWEDSSTIFGELQKRGVDTRRHRTPGFSK